MNIFFTNNDAIICADEHCITHTNKMITEYAQMLSTAHRVLDGEPYRDEKNILRHRLRDWRETVLYKSTHVNHPCNKWVRSNVTNYNWLLVVLMRLCENYRLMKGKAQKVELAVLDSLMNPPESMSEGEFSTPPFSAPDDMKAKINLNQDVTACYKEFIIQKILLWEKYPEMGKREVNTEFYQEPVWYREIRQRVE